MEHTKLYERILRLSVVFLILFKPLTKIRSANSGCPGQMLFSMASDLGRQVLHISLKQYVRVIRVKAGFHSKAVGRLGQNDPLF